MIEYEINLHRTSFIYWEDIDVVGIALPDTIKCLSQNELSDYIADNFTHEHMHRAIYKLFDKTTCQLFDAIEHNFRNHKLHEKGIGVGEVTQTIETYKSFIKRNGFNAFLGHYNIDNTARNQAYIICGGK